MRRAPAPVLAAAGILLGLAALLLLQSPHRTGRPSAPPELGLSLLERLSGFRGGEETIHPFRDESGCWHIRMDLSLDRLNALTPGLESEIAARGGRIESRQEERRDRSLRFLWKIREKGGRERAVLLFLCPWNGAADQAGSGPDRPAAAIIIDDAGYNLELIRELAALRKPLTIAILPDAPLAGETAALAAREGLEVMLHLPLEPAGEAPGAAIVTIRPDMDAAAIRRLMDDFLRKVPGARGVNNHTGSLATEDAAVMKSVLAVLKERGMYFIDSRTTKKSVAFAAARAMGVPAAERGFFLDQPPGAAAVESRLKELFRAARKKGIAVGIGHARRASVEALRSFLGRADAEGVRLVFASAVVR
jgi:polysaccharide deacetylase 2 family uncharacterized protein YibQ